MLPRYEKKNRPYFNINLTACTVSHKEIFIIVGQGCGREHLPGDFGLNESKSIPQLSQVQIEFIFIYFLLFGM